MSEELTMQRYFTETVEYLRNQNQKAVDGNNSCVYHNDRGNKCAVGYWIPDSFLLGDRLSEIGGVFELNDYHPELRGIAWLEGDEGLKLADELQMLHDDNNPNHNFRTPSTGGLSAEGEKKAEAIAVSFCLMYTPPS